MSKYTEMTDEQYFGKVIDTNLQHSSTNKTKGRNMSDYLYAVIPYNKGVTLYSPDELEEGRSYPVIPELKDIDSKYAEGNRLKLFADFLMINTCGRQSWFTNNEDGYSQLRAEIYKIALQI